MARTTFSGPVGIGTGEGTATPVGGTLLAPAAAGTNVAGTALTIQGGTGTGSGAGGAINFQTAPAGSSGTTAGTPATVLSIASTGLLTIGATATAGQPVLARTLALAVTATANTDLTLTVPVNCRILRMSVATTTAFTGNTVTIQVGVAAAGATLVAAVDIKAKAALHALTLLDAVADSLDLSTVGTLFVRIIQTATTTAVGAGTLVVEYQRL